MANNITDEEITRLAREYAEEYVNSDKFLGMWPDIKPTMITMTMGGAMDFMRFLLRSHCLVEKSRVKEEYKSAKSDCKMVYREKLYSMLAVAEMRKALLETLFGDTLKVERGTND